MNPTGLGSKILIVFAFAIVICAMLSDVSDNINEESPYQKGLMTGIEIGYSEVTDTVFKVTNRLISKIESAPMNKHMIMGIPAVGPEVLDSNYLKFIKAKHNVQNHSTGR